MTILRDQLAHKEEQGEHTSKEVARVMEERDELVKKLISRKSATETKTVYVESPMKGIDPEIFEKLHKERDFLLKRVDEYKAQLALFESDRSQFEAERVRFLKEQQ